jgi:hypothetical protein
MRRGDQLSVSEVLKSFDYLNGFFKRVDTVINPRQEVRVHVHITQQTFELLFFSEDRA